MNLENTATQTPKRPLYKRPVFWILTLILLPSFVFLLWRTHLAIEMSNKLDKIAADGYPISGNQLNAYYKPVLDSRNAALLMDEAFYAIQYPTNKKAPSIDSIPLLRDEPLDAKDKEAIQDYVFRNTEAMDTASKALQRPECRYPIDLRNGITTLLPHLSKLKEIARLFQYRAYLAAESGQGQDAVKDIASIPAAAQTLDEEPTLISQLVRIAILNIGIGEMEHCFNHCQLNDSDLTALSSAYTLKQTNRMALGLIGERALMAPNFRMSLKQMRQIGGLNSATFGPSSAPVTQPTGIGELNSPVSLLGATGFFERDLNFYLDALDSGIRSSRLPPPLCLESTNALAAQADKAKSSYYVLSAMTLPSLSTAVVKEVRLTALLRLTQSAIAVERYRLAQGKLPSSLNDLVPQYLPSVPEDPFDGKPMRFKLLKKGYVIYSIGADGVDDGGRERLSLAAAKAKKIKMRSNETYDITFTVER